MRLQVKCYAHHPSLTMLLLFVVDMTKVCQKEKKKLFFSLPCSLFLEARVEPDGSEEIELPQLVSFLSVGVQHE